MVKFKASCEAIHTMLERRKKNAKSSCRNYRRMGTRLAVLVLWHHEEWEESQMASMPIYLCLMWPKNGLKTYFPNKDKIIKKIKYMLLLAGENRS